MLVRRCRSRLPVRVCCSAERAKSAVVDCCSCCVGVGLSPVCVSDVMASAGQTSAATDKARPHDTSPATVVCGDIEVHLPQSLLS